MKAATSSLFNARPHPGPLPRGEGATFAVAFVNPRLDWRTVHSINGERALAIPSPGGEGQGEGGCFTIQSERAYVGRHRSA